LSSFPSLHPPPCHCWLFLSVFSVLVFPFGLLDLFDALLGLLCTFGRHDHGDNVQVVAAQVCVPSVGATASLDPSAVATLAEVLWNMLPDLSDISGATSSVLQLLGALYSRDETATEADAQARLLLLWPFFHHTSSEVQVEACCCCRVLCKIIFQAEIATPTDPLLAQTARQVLHLSYQKLLTTKHPRVADGAADLAIFIVERCPVSMLGAALDAQLIHTLSGLPCMPLGEPLPRECLFMSESSAHSPRFRTEVIGGGEDDACVAGRKIRCAKILARALELCAAHPEQPTCHLAATNMQNMMGTFLQHPSVTAQMFAALVYLFWLLRCRGPAQSVPAAVHEQLFAALSNAPLVHMQELSTLHSQVIANLASLLNALSEAQTPAQLPLGFSLDSVDASYATTILAAVAPAVPDDDSHHVAAAHAAATAAVERLIEEAGVLRSVLCAMVAAACAAWRGLPERVTSLVQPLMGGLRRIADSQLHAEVLAPAIAELMLACAHRTPSPNDKILHHLNTLAFGTRSDVAAESTPSVASGEQYAANGAVSVLKMLALRAADSLDTRLPQLWDLIISPPVAYAAATGTPSHVQRTAMLRAASLLRCIAADLHPNLHERLKPLLPTLIACMQRAADDDEETALVATALAALSAAQPDVHLEFLASTASAYMEASEPPPFRVAAVSLLNALLDTSTAVTNALLPYLLLLATPALACMTDPVPRVRVPAAQAFGRIVALLPLAPLDALPATPTLSTKLRAKREADAKFLQQLMSARIEPYVPPVMPKGVELRHYQRDGISWLAFLRRFGLHGILADDMGLGKTIQSLTIVAAAMHDGRSTAPSLIVCPASLVGHWEAEARQYFGHYGMRPVAVQGSAVQRAALQEQVAAEGEPGRVLVVTSYDVVRNSMAWLSQTTFEYFILDEGHIIRNPKAKVSRACKQIAARHRLILSGTPIQNSARELWALFDFLMPGLLGTETAFQRRFKATAAPSVGVSRQAAAKDQEALMLALNELHQQVLPFILRRSKDQVLQDLPPKLMQDIMCDLSPLQRTLYDGVMAAQVAGGKNAAQTASFELLIYLRKLCSHPCLAISWDFAEHVAAAQTAMPECSGTIELKQALPCLAQSPKLQALQQLLTNCGIIKGEPTDGDALVGAAADAESGHRVLVFAQLRTMLDLVESTVLGPAGLPFVRLDGGVKPKDRQEVVQRFNGDPTIPVMLLTTAVGSLGLNLTSADTVVFLEHDWNPMKDMQAMDRAHRLGQKRIVSVYRLLMRGTLEERIMSLQHFKKEVASSVVNAENIALESMETEGLLDVMGASASAGQGGLPLVQQPAQQHEAPDGSEQYDDSSMAAFLKRYQSSVFTEPS
jgi:TATA-binding protein-associated factor